MTATAADYTWFSQRYPGLAQAFCFTLVRGLTPTELLHRLGAREQIRLTGVDELVEPAYGAWDAHAGDQLFLGVTAAGGWALAVEPNGYLGITEAAVVPLSVGTRLVSHFRNVNAVDHFYWIENGDIRLDFEPLFPADRFGSDPDGLADMMRQVGFDLRADEDRSFELHTEAAFALAEYLTGVRLTPELLDSATFLCGTAPLPGR
jgi:hypothetical protein